ncbi:MAG: hypothetical protein Q8P58_01515, partial [Candidatus Adlerbacteria bacterium]|nr:hypothetical protein [Candidatus Adlerbacteria bacterium]
NGPVVSATVVQTLQPTTTIARYVQQNNGHVFDLLLDSSGAVPKAISNTTIPGVARALWAQGGGAVILQYLDGNITKTVSLTFPPQNATTTQPVAIKFLPDGIRDIAVSPSGTRVVYLLRTANGVDGYTAATNGTGSAKLFSLPLSEILISWPSTNTLLAYTKSTLGTPGVAFSISASAGAVVPLLYAPGLTLTADPTYSYLVYQTGDSAGPSTYVRNSTDGTSAGLSFDPYPEKCIWASAITLYCAAPLTYTVANYLDLWHAGTATEAEALYAFTFPGGQSSIVAVPGGEEGGVGSTIDTLSVSPDQKYLLFVRRGDRSLWGVRLGQ